MGVEATTRHCPYCKEEIRAGAIKCKHCGSAVIPEKAPHDGVCPYCKEEIHPQAMKCKHCKSMLTAEADCGCGGQKQSLQLKEFLSQSQPHTAFTASEGVSFARQSVGNRLGISDIIIIGPGGPCRSVWVPCDFSWPIKWCEVYICAPFPKSLSKQ